MNQAQEIQALKEALHKQEELNRDLVNGATLRTAEIEFWKRKAKEFEHKYLQAEMQLQSQLPNSGSSWA